MVTCHADISFPVLKLTQYNTSPATCHAEAIKAMYRYLNATLSEGIIFWRPRLNTNIIARPEPVVDDSTYKVFIPPEHDIIDLLYGFSDYDLANDTSHRKSIGGTALMFASGCVVYKTILQRTVALSSTETELYALTETGNLVL